MIAITLLVASWTPDTFSALTMHINLNSAINSKITIIIVMLTMITESIANKIFDTSVCVSNV